MSLTVADTLIKVADDCDCCAQVVELFIFRKQQENKVGNMATHWLCIAFCATASELTPNTRHVGCLAVPVAGKPAPRQQQ